MFSSVLYMTYMYIKSRQISQMGHVYRDQLHIRLNIISPQSCIDLFKWEKNTKKIFERILSKMETWVLYWNFTWMYRPEYGVL